MLPFYTLTMNYQNIKKANPFIIASKNKITGNKYNQGDVRPIVRKLYETDKRN